MSFELRGPGARGLIFKLTVVLQVQADFWEHDCVGLLPQSFYLERFSSCVFIYFAINVIVCF